MDMYIVCYIERFHMTSAILVFQNNEMAVMFVYQTNPVGVVEQRINSEVQLN